MADAKSDIAWAAGFFEGEGTVVYGNKNLGAHIKVQATQCYLEPLERMQSIFGGNLYGPYEGKKDNWSQHWKWEIGKLDDVAHFIWSVSHWLSERRLVQALDRLEWALNKRELIQSTCKNNLHEMTEENKLYRKDHILCRQCKRDKEKRYRDGRL